MEIRLRRRVTKGKEGNLTNNKHLHVVNIRRSHNVHTFEGNFRKRCGAGSMRSSNKAENRDWNCNTNIGWRTVQWINHGSIKAVIRQSKVQPVITKFDAIVKAKLYFDGMLWPHSTRIEFKLHSIYTIEADLYINITALQLSLIIKIQSPDSSPSLYALLESTLWPASTTHKKIEKLKLQILILIVEGTLRR